MPRQRQGARRVARQPSESCQNVKFQNARRNFKRAPTMHYISNIVMVLGVNIHASHPASRHRAIFVKASRFCHSEYE